MIKETHRLDWQTNDSDPTPEIGQITKQNKKVNKMRREGEGKWEQTGNKPMMKKIKWNKSRKHRQEMCIRDRYEIIKNQ